MGVPTLDNTTRPRAFGFGVALNGRLFRLAAGPGREARVSSATVSGSSVNTAQHPEEFVSDVLKTFARTDFSGGEGLDRAHRRDGLPSDPRRFWRSHGVVVVDADDGTGEYVRLARALEQVQGSTAVNSVLGGHMVAEGGRLYVAAGNLIRKTSNPEADPPSWSTEDPHAGDSATPIRGLARLDDYLYASTGHGIHRRALTSGTWAHWSDLADAAIHAVKGRLVALKQGSLYEVTAAGAAPTATLNIGVEHTLRGVADVGAGVLVGCTDGYVYALESNAGVLELVGQTYFAEPVDTVAAVQGVALIATRDGATGRLYRAGYEAGVLTDVVLLREWLVDTVGFGGFDTARRRVTFQRSNTNGDVEVWVYDVATGGLFHVYTEEWAGVGGTVLSAGRLYLVTSDGVVYRRSETSYVPSGWLMTPLADFFTSLPKGWTEVAVDGAVSQAARLKVSATTTQSALGDAESPRWRQVHQQSTSSGIETTPLDLPTSRYIAGKADLTTTDVTETPELRSISFSGLPTSTDIEVTLPVNVSDFIERRGGRSRVRGRGQSEWLALMALESLPVEVELFRPGLSLEGVVMSVDTPVPTMTRRGTPLLVSQVVIRGKRVAGVTAQGGVLGASSPLGASVPFGLVEV